MDESRLELFVADAVARGDSAELNELLVAAIAGGHVDAALEILDGRGFVPESFVEDHFMSEEGPRPLVDLVARTLRAATDVARGRPRTLARDITQLPRFAAAAGDEAAVRALIDAAGAAVPCDAMAAGARSAARYGHERIVRAIVDGGGRCARADLLEQAVDGAVSGGHAALVASLAHMGGTVDLGSAAMAYARGHADLGLDILRRAPFDEYFADEFLLSAIDRADGRAVRALLARFGERLPVTFDHLALAADPGVGAATFRALLRHPRAAYTDAALQQVLRVVITEGNEGALEALLDDDRVIGHAGAADIVVGLRAPLWWRHALVLIPPAELPRTPGRSASEPWYLRCEDYKYADTGTPFVRAPEDFVDAVAFVEHARAHGLWVKADAGCIVQLNNVRAMQERYGTDVFLSILAGMIEGRVVMEKLREVVRRRVDA